jgi:uncharacterized membrane protein
LFFLQWIHTLSGITWIGILFYFNFVLTPFLEEAEAPVQIVAMKELVTRALWSFRWGAMFTFLSGILIYIHRLAEIGGTVFYASPYGLTITVGGSMGTIMFLNGWLVMWPKQKVVIASATQVAEGGQPIPEAKACGRRVVLASRTNTLLSIPMLFFMGAASHYPLIGVKVSGASPAWFWIVTLAIIGAVELNALVGTQGATKKPLDTVSGTLCLGFTLTAILYSLFLILL